jgi:Uma2 family endonuclease
MGAKTLLSLEEFMALPDDGNKYELNQGELVVMPMANAEHGLIVNNITLILSNCLQVTGLGRAFAEMGYALFRNPELTIRQPDVSFLSRDRVRKEQGYYEGAPELAVEVVSPRQDAADLNVKVEQYLAAEGREVWVAYPRTRSVYIYRPGGTADKLSDRDTMASDLFPGWSARVADFFDLDY